MCLSCEKRHCQSISALSLSRQVLLEQNLCLEMHLWILTESYEGKAKTIFPFEKDGMPCYHFFKNPMHLQGLCLKIRLWDQKNLIFIYKTQLYI